MSAVRLVFSGVLLLALCLSCSSASAARPREILVGGYHFPPYLIKPEEQEQGLTPDLVAQLNRLQARFHFSIVPTSAARRYRDLEQGRYDLMLFEDPDWGWNGVRYQGIDMRTSDAEVYIARTQPGRGQAFFDDLAGKRLALYSGYHYGFAGFDADPEYLVREFNALMTYSHDSNLLMVLRGRADIALVTRSYLGMYLERNPEQKAQFLVSTRVDQNYRHYALLRPGAAITPERFTVLLDLLRASGELQRIFGRYQIQVTPASLDSSVMPDGRD
ncbi:substrate-binding periplasmic protein [Pseudomonas sp. TUM22785]|uniref:substrate-binding periplasmic protein n=1 Tax=Pseudomonas sp. TUM22785 TaxID=3019098 RepID=UPI0023050CDB|nr:transporter substrate-binding domain-containing protein [Pseudomonas sp. TUM22785]WCD82366.1 transporter substrate-binding domain-containing protein [Pseudomonas sp. TUM22785]